MQKNEAEVRRRYLSAMLAGRLLVFLGRNLLGNGRLLGLGQRRLLFVAVGESFGALCFGGSVLQRVDLAEKVGELAELRMPLTLLLAPDRLVLRPSDVHAVAEVRILEEVFNVRTKKALLE